MCTGDEHVEDSISKRESKVPSELQGAVTGSRTERFCSLICRSRSSCCKPAISAGAAAADGIVTGVEGVASAGDPAALTLGGVNILANCGGPGTGGEGSGIATEATAVAAAAEGDFPGVTIGGLQPLGVVPCACGVP